MRTTILSSILMLLFSVLAAAAGAPQNGVVEGTLEPRDASAQIAAEPESGAGAPVLGASASGMFRLLLAPGTYRIIVSAPVSSFPVRLDNVVVRAGETTTLPPVLIMPGSGQAVLSGTVRPALPDSDVELYSEGRERAVARTDREGRYEFGGLPAGEYEVQVSAPGHARDRAPVVIPENQRVTHTTVLLPVAVSDGVDWATGTVRATGIGHVPQNADNAAQVRAMTQRAALADAQRNLLRVVTQIKIDDKRTVAAIMAMKTGAERIQGFLRGYTVVSERQLPDRSIEIVLELPLTGPRGLSRYLAE